MKAREIAELVGGILTGDGDIELSGVNAVDRAGAGEIAFVERSDLAANSNASCLLVGQSVNASAPAIITVENPKLAFAKAAAKLQHTAVGAHVHPSAVVARSATIGEGVRLGAGVAIGENVTVGRDCVFHPNVVIEDGCAIGDNVILHAGVVIGADGFGYVPDENNVHQKFPQIGTVVIESDVEIGANTCIDRGALGETRIGEGTKIDNLVQIAHNVQIGKRVIIAAQTGISGSTVIEDDCIIGGQVGMGDHATVKSGAVIGSQAGVLPGKIVRPGVWWGTPVQPLDEYKRQNAHVKGLSRLKDDIKDLKRLVAELLKK
jgi:UDP-3-O-[3-hydroxymyristoyl] glucosamine N-acyltransferase